MGQQHLDVATWIRSQAALIIQQYTAHAQKATKGLTYCEEPGAFGANVKSCTTYKTRKKKQAVVFGQDNGRLPGPTGRVLVPNYPVCLFPFSSRFPLFLAVK